MNKKLSLRDASAIEAGKQRLISLQKDIETIQAIADDQVGTGIPKVFTSKASNFIVNPSNVGTGVLDRMIKTDDTINSAVQFKIMMILSKLGEYDHVDKKIKDFVQKILKEMRGPTWASAQESMLSYHGYNFSVSEIVFGLDKKLNKVPKKIATYHPSTLAFEVNEAGEITEDGILQYTQQRAQFANINYRFQTVRHGFKVSNPFETPVDRLHPVRVPITTQLGLVRIPRNKVIHMIGQEWHGFGNPYGDGGVRTAHLLWQLKVFVIKQLGIATKRKSTPKIWATAPKGMQQVEVARADGTKETVSPAEAVRAMLTDVQDFDSIVTHSETDGYKVTTLDDTADLSQIVNVINEINTWMFRCFLLPSLVMTDGSAGSRSLGDKHFQIVDRIAEADADKFGESIINQMLERLIIENFGEQEDYGKFLRRPQTIDERQRMASMFGQLGNDGWISPALESDMSMVRDSLNLTPVDKDFFKADINDLDFDTDLIPGEKIPDEDGETEANPEKVDIILKVLEAMKNGSVSPESAVELLIEGGIDSDRASKIVKGSENIEPVVEPEPSPSEDLSPNPDPQKPEPTIDPEPEIEKDDPDKEKAEKLSMEVMGEVSEAFVNFILQGSDE